MLHHVAQFEEGADNVAYDLNDDYA